MGRRQKNSLDIKEQTSKYTAFVFLQKNSRIYF